MQRLSPLTTRALWMPRPEDKGEDVRREICLTLEDMGVTPESSHHSGGPGQNIIDFQHSSAIQSADDVITYKSVVKTMGVEKRPYGVVCAEPHSG